MANIKNTLLNAIDKKKKEIKNRVEKEVNSGKRAIDSDSNFIEVGMKVKTISDIETDSGLIRKDTIFIVKALEHNNQIVVDTDDGTTVIQARKVIKI